MYMMMLAFFSLSCDFSIQQPYAVGGLHFIHTFFKPRSGGSHRYMHSIYKESAAAAVDMSEIVKHAATLAALASRNFA